MARPLFTAAGLTRRRLLAGAGAAGLAVSLRPLATAVAASGDPADFDAAVPTAWFDLAGRLVRDTPGFSPPVAARAFGYAGVALYEAIVPGARDYRSLQGVLPGLEELPRGNPSLHAPTAANAALATTLRALFAESPVLASIDALESSLAGGLERDVPTGIRRRSVEHGRRVGEAVMAWSRTDGTQATTTGGTTTTYAPPVGAGLWVPTPPGFQPALLPGWGRTRCLAIVDGAACAPAEPTPFSVDPSSAFFAEAREVYDTTRGLTGEQRAIAEFWSDDPGRTATPPGHSISIATQVLEAEHSSLLTAAETYAKVGIAVADAFVGCWNTKFRFNLLRPVTYIQQQIDPAWLPPLTTPPFPEYTSGHSVQSAAAFTVLAHRFGERYEFVDHTHDELGLAPRRFTSFSAAAEEAAISRLYGGIHFRPAIERGIDQGRCIGEAVIALPYRES
jgi:membrane-associated phospholipid phosphatase